MESLRRRAIPAQVSDSADTSRAPAGGQSANRTVLKAIVLGPIAKQHEIGQSKELPYDDFLEILSADSRIIEPPFDPLVLAMLPEHSTELMQCVDAMETNIDGFGHKLDCRVLVDLPQCPDDLRREVKREKTRLTNFLNNCCLRDTFTGLRRKSRKDLETTGNAFWEVLRNPVTGEIDGFNHLPSYQMRLAVQDPEATRVEIIQPMLQEDDSISLEKVETEIRFRRFIQARIGSLSRSFGQGRGFQIRWFKEFGDPRPIDYDTGNVIEDLSNFPKEKLASEVLHWKIYSSRSPYGLPRLIGNLITIFGDRAADEVNFITLKNNNIPSLMIFVSGGGKLTEKTVERLQEFVETNVQGSPNRSRIIIVEAESPIMESGDTGAVKIDIKELIDSQHKDQMFQEYQKNNSDKIRRAFRLPPIFVGRADDYSRATAIASRKLADEQIFRPERDEFDNQVNKLLFPVMGVKYHRFESKGPNVTDDEDLIRVQMGAERTGGMTPRISREIISDIMGRDLGPVNPEKLDPDIPFSLQLAEAVKNKAEITVPTQVTALKDVDAIVEALWQARELLYDKLSKPR